MKIAIIIVLVVLVIVVALAGYFGAFSKVFIQRAKAGGEVLAYENVTGSYSQTNKVSNKVYDELLNDFGIETTKGFGIFYDNPKNVEESKLRSEVGCILENVDDATLEKIKEKFQVKTLPSEDYVVAEFPLKGTISIIMGIIKVYPAMEKYAVQNNLKDGPIMEIYDIPNKKIIYRKMLSK